MGAAADLVHMHGTAALFGHILPDSVHITTGPRPLRLLSFSPQLPASSRLPVLAGLVGTAHLPHSTSGTAPLLPVGSCHPTVCVPSSPPARSAVCHPPRVSTCALTLGLTWYSPAGSHRQRAAVLRCHLERWFFLCIPRDG